MLRMRSLARGLVAIVALSATLFAGDTDKSAADWPQWRGPHRDGVAEETGLLQRWPAEGPPLAWKTSGLGEGYASVAIADGKIFTMGKRKNVVFVIARDASDGHELWATQVGAHGGDAPSSTPTIDGDRVYAISAQGDLVCVNAADGKKKLWHKSFTKDFGGSVPGWKFCESPLVDGDKLVCTPGGAKATMVALDKMTGKPIWKCAVPGGAGNGSGYSSIVVSEAAGVRQYVQLMGAETGCIGVAAKDGTFLWNYPRVSNGTASIPTPIAHGAYVFCSSGYGTGSALLKLSRSGNGVKAEEVYFLGPSQLQNHHGGLVLVGDYVYGGQGHNSGFPICVEMKTGKVKWAERGPGSGSAAVVYADRQLYFRYQDGLMALISASPEGYNLNGTFRIPVVPRESWTHPVVAGGKLYLREQDNLFVYDVHAR
jgi:outer membrane protein assembly factor BamB